MVAGSSGLESLAATELDAPQPYPPLPWPCLPSLNFVPHRKHPAGKVRTVLAGSLGLTFRPASKGRWVTRWSRWSALGSPGQAHQPARASAVLPSRPSNLWPEGLMLTRFPTSHSIEWNPRPPPLSTHISLPSRMVTDRWVISAPATVRSHRRPSHWPPAVLLRGAHAAGAPARVPRGPVTYKWRSVFRSNAFKITKQGQQSKHPRAVLLACLLNWCLMVPLR